MQSSWRSLGIAPVAALVLAFPGFAAPPEGIAETFSERSAAALDAAAERARERQLHDRLVTRQAAGGLDGPIEIELSETKLQTVETADARQRKILVGAVEGLGEQVVLGRRAVSFGAVSELDGGTRVWTGVVRSEGATALRLRFAGFRLPEGWELYLYSPAGQVRGPYSGRGPSGDGAFWSHTIFGPEVILQAEGPADVARAPRFKIRDVGHMGSLFQLPERAGYGDSSLKAFCSFNESCVENVNCGGTSSAINDARDAAAHILFRSGGFFFICSGGLLNDTDTSTQRPLFLTANHCLSKGREASSMEAFFQFDTPCGGACYDPDGVVPSTLGSRVLKTGRAADYTLLELDEPAPAGSAFMGWTSAAVAFTSGTQLFRVSHPSGAPQAYSEHEVDASAVTCSGWNRGDRIYSRDLFGATEGGSSGSPVVNSSGQVVGQLSGACGFDVNDPCNSVDNATVDGALAAYFADVASILDPGSGGGGTCTPGSGAKGDACTEDSDCASCKCKGPSGAKTCK